MQTAEELDAAEEALEAYKDQILIDLGDAISEEKKYRNVKGFDAIILYLVTTYGWSPREIRTTETDDLLTVLSNEIGDYRI